MTNNQQKNLFFIDAETDGLHGSFISVGIIVTDARCNEIQRFYYGVDRKTLNVTDAWTREHVLPILGDYEACADEEELLQKVWEAWLSYADNAYAVGDVIFPVEARLFQRCVLLDEPNNRYKAPFPLLDLSSLLYSKGLDPLTDRESLLEQKPEGIQHNALYDVEVMVGNYKRCILESNR
jgi:hypothetical protein